ncbi:MAG: hypothetical protein R3F02_07490 [Thiolinea sp.]
MPKAWFVKILIISLRHSVIMMRGRKDGSGWIGIRMVSLVSVCRVVRKLGKVFVSGGGGRMGSEAFIVAGFTEKLMPEIPAMAAYYRVNHSRKPNQAYDFI